MIKADDSSLWSTLGACVIEKHFTLDRTMIIPTMPHLWFRGMELIKKYATVHQSLARARTISTKWRCIKYGVSVTSRRAIPAGKVVKRLILW